MRRGNLSTWIGIGCAGLCLFVASLAWGQAANPRNAPPRARVEAASPRENDPEEDDESIFAERDTNDDEVLSGTEAKGLERFDADKDGEISKAEFLDGRAALRENVVELAKAAEQAFQSLDKNQDGRLSGNEMAPFRQYDANGDKRVTIEEFLAGLQADRRKKRQTPGGEIDLQLLITAIRTQNVDELLSKSDATLRANIDRPVIELFFAAIPALLGDMAAEQAGATKVLAVDVDGGKRYDHIGTLAFENGEVTAMVQVLNGRVVGLSLNSDQLEGANQWIYDRLAKDQKAAKATAEFYRPQCEKILSQVLNGDTDTAFALFHPLIQKQLDKGSTKEYLESIKNQFGDFEEAELESQRITTNEQGDDAELSYLYDVKAEKADFTASITFQFIGMQAGFKKLSVTRKSDANAPPKPAPPAADEAAAGWTLQKFAAEKMQVRCPTTLARKQEKDGSIAYAAQTADRVYGYEVRIHSFDDDVEASGKEILDNFKTTLPEKLGGELLDASDLPFEGHPGRVFVIRMGDGRMYFNRCILSKNRMIQVQMVTRDEDRDQASKNATRFIESLASLASDGKAPTDDDDAPAAPAPPVPAPPAPPRVAPPAAPAPPAPPAPIPAPPRP